MTINKNKIVSYNYIATEYYDEVFHPTCANFRSASKLIIASLLELINKPLRNILEVGAGKSVASEVFCETKKNYETFIISDKDEIMLNYSISNSGCNNCSFRIIDAERMELNDSSQDLIVSSLGDPYNTPEMWNEIRRVLRPGGICIFTTPSYEWATGFRNNNSDFHFAEFKTIKNELVYVPSYVYNEVIQEELFKSSKLHLLKVQHSTLNQIDQNTISQKLISEKGNNLDIVTGYMVEKK